MQYFLQDVEFNITWARIEEPSLYWMSSAVRGLKYYYTPCAVTLGTACNVTSLVIFSRKCFRQISCTPYLIAVAAVDTALLITLLLTWFHIYGIDTYNKGGGCQAVTLVSYVCNFLSVWCTASAVMDRTISAHQSPGTRSIFSCTRVKANVLVMLFSVVSLVVYLNISLLYGVVYINPHISVCIPIRSAFRAIHILGQADAIWNFAIPYFLIVILNAWCCRKLYVIREQRNSIITAVDLQGNTTELIRIPHEEIYMSYMIIVSSMFYILLNLPGHILRLYTSLTSERYATDEINRTLLFLWQQSLFYLFVTRAAGNLLCYLCNPLFRKQLKSMLSKLLICSALKHYRDSLEYSIYSLPLYTTNHHRQCASVSTRL